MQIKDHGEGFLQEGAVHPWRKEPCQRWKDKTDEKKKNNIEGPNPGKYAKPPENP